MSKSKELSGLYNAVIFFNEKNILEVPNNPGVFLLYNETGEQIYIGASARLQQELLKCLRAYNSCLVTTKYFTVELNPDYQRGEILAFKAFKQNNRGKIPKCNHRDPTQLKTS